jgi:hypothetical protein
MPGRALILTLAALVALAAAAAPASATHSRGKCTARGTTIAKNDTGRVFERPRNVNVTLLMGCLWSRNRPFVMGEAWSDGYVVFESFDRLRLRGHFAAWLFTRSEFPCKGACPPGYDGTTQKVEVYDMRTGTKAKQMATKSQLTALRLNAAGSLAWLRSAGGANYEAHAWDRSGHTVVDTGPISQFRLRGSTLSWLSGDAERTAALRGSAASAPRR